MRIITATVLLAIVAQAGLPPSRLSAAADLRKTCLCAEHEKFKIVGTVAALKQDEIAIKAIDGATYEIDFLDTAVVTNKSHAKVDRATLKVGERVVVLALGHDMFDLEAFEVQLTDR